ncbi:MAG: 50S ribosomal protein L29 [Luteolibacter sp.]|jgi:large subunit ribosomal protein L29
MALTKISVIRESTKDELLLRLRDLKEEAFNLRLQQATGQLENSDRIRVVRREIARVNTILKQKQSA